jgi:TolB-like protein
LAGSFCAPANLTKGQSYEVGLKAVAASLVAKLEEANQHSGTVLDFTDLQGSPNELGRFLAQELSDQLVSAGKKMSFVDRANLQTLLREHKLSVEGLVNPESTRKLGNLIGIDTIIFGTTTSMGDKIRLSVRAVNVETGKIVASQTTALPAIGGLGELYTHGVASAPPGAELTRPDARARFRADSIKTTGVEALIHTHFGASVRFVLENLSGTGFEAAIKRGTTALGPCIGNESRISGLNLIKDEAPGTIPIGGQTVKQFQYFPDHGKITVTIDLFGCNASIFAGAKTTNVSTSLVISLGKDEFTFPLSVSELPVRYTTP